MDTLTLLHPDITPSGRFCWLDLAASDADSAKAFYGSLFGWTSLDRPANGGRFTRLRMANRDVGSLYQINRMLLDRGIDSHWTPYIRVDSVDDTARRAGALGGTVLVRPFDVMGMARIAVILDSVGAQLGLWQSLGAEE